MSRRLVVRVALVGALVWTLSLIGDFAPGLLAKVPVFRARNHEFHGLRFLNEEMVRTTAGIGPEASLWDDPTPWEEALERHPLVREAHVDRRFPSTLVVRVQERAPVGLVPTPTLAPVDAEGNLLPLDPARFPLDYPILRVATVSDEEGETLSGIRLRKLAGAAAVLRADAEFWSAISEVAEGTHGELLVRRGSPEVVFLFPPQVEPHRIREGMAVLEDALARSQGRAPIRVDLRFEDNVFLDWGREGRP